MSHKLVSLYIGEGEYYTRTDVDNVLAEKDQEIAELKLKLEDLQNTYKESVEIKSQIWERCKKAEADASETRALLEERNKQVGELKSDIADLRDDKKLTDAILDERNAEIAELKAQKAQAEDDCAYWKTMSRKCADDNEVMAKQRADAFKRERHHKYKRCLAMARWCSERIARIEKDYAFWRHGKDYASNFYKRWRKRWLELAEKFKEVK